MRNLIIAALILVASALAQAQGGNFQGQVRYENDAPAPFVRVELWSDINTFRAYATTDRMGKFDVQVPCSMIQYKIEMAGYKPAYGHTNLSVITAGDTTRNTPCRGLEEITLKALPGTTLPGSTPPAQGTVDARIAAITPDAKKEFDAGQKAVTANDFAGAIPHLQKAIALYPNYAEAYQLLGLSQLQTQHAPEAEASLTKAIQIEDKMPQAQYLLGMLLAMTNRANLAEKPFTRFAELDPANPDAHFELAKTEFALNKFDQSELHARKAIELKEKNPGVEVVLAYSLLRQKKAAEARDAFKQYLKLDPNSPMKADVEKTIAMIDEHEKQAK